MRVLHERTRDACRQFVSLRNLLNELSSTHPAHAALAAAVLHADQTWQSLAQDLAQAETSRRHHLSTIAIGAPRSHD